MEQLQQTLNSHKISTDSRVHPAKLGGLLADLRNLPVPVTVEVIGRSRFDEDAWPLYAVTLGAHGPSKRIVLWACQHHSPENEGASALIELARLCANDEGFRSLLNETVFVVLPQQNPDGIVREGNWGWMERPTLERFLLCHQYDNRDDDCEHGIIVGAEDRMRREPHAFKKYVDSLINERGRVDFYLSGHSWDIAGGPLFLVAGQAAGEFAESLSAWVKALGMQLHPQPYLSENYVLAPVRPDLPGFFTIPTTAHMRERVPDAGYQLHTLEYLLSYCGTPLACVAEPNVFQCNPMLDMTPTDTTVRGVCDDMAADARRDWSPLVEEIHGLACKAPDSWIARSIARRMEKKRDAPGSLATLGDDPNLCGDRPATCGELHVRHVKHALEIGLLAAAGLKLSEEGTSDHARYGEVVASQLGRLEALDVKLASFADAVKSQIAALIVGLKTVATLD